MAVPPRKDAAVDGLPPCKRYIATHTPQGKSIYAPSPSNIFNITPGTGGMARSYAVGSVPANLTDDADVDAYKATEGPTSFRAGDIVLPVPGANLGVVDLEPAGTSLMHQTVSIDYSICVIGDIECELDSGEKVRLLPGDHVIQRGTMHRWTNLSKTQPARFVAVTIPCIPFDVAGEQLTQKFIPNEKKETKI